MSTPPLRISPAAAPAAAPMPPARPGSPGMLLRLLLVLPAAVLLLTPFALLTVVAAEEPEVLAVLADKPLVALQLAAGLMISVLFCGLPLSRVLDRIAAGVRSGAAPSAATMPAPPLNAKVALSLAA